MTATPIYRARSFANALLLSAALALSACGGEGAFAWKPETPAEKQLRESRENLQRTVGEGGVAGAVGGAVIGGLLGGVGGAFQGAEIGRFAGAASGAYVRNLQAEFASKEEILDQVITDLEVTNTRLEETIAAMRGVVAETRAAATPDPTRVQRNLEEAQAAVRAAEGQDAFFGATRSILEKDVAPVAGTEFDPALARLKNRIETMRSIAKELAAL